MTGVTVNSPHTEGQAKIESSQRHKRILFRNKSSLQVGELNRYVISYTPSEASEAPPTSLWLKVKNMEALPLRAAYLAGPYILYVDVRPEDYDQNVRNFTTGSKPSYESQLKANQSFYAELHMNKIKKKHTWIVDVVSQIIFSTGATISFELLVGHHKEDLHGNLHTAVQAAGEGGLRVQKQDTLDIWHSPTPRHDSPLHLVVVTHGLHSNTGSDMLYVKEKIDEMARKTGENIIVRGYFGNVCRTEKGIKYLGRRLGDYILQELAPKVPQKGNPPVSKISFIAHSLGGLVQTFAIAHIQSSEPDFFGRIQPVNFITLATPFLGISNENPGYIKFALDIGFAGKTGQDLGLTWKPSTKKGHKPLLQVLPTGPTHEALSKFTNRTLYANAVNDGIVPLRTSAILYLDWRALAKAARVKRGEDADKKEDNESSSDDERETGEIPEDLEKRNDNNAIGNKNTNSNNNNGNKAASSSSTSPSKTTTSNDFLNSVTGPFNSLFSFLAPQAGGKRPSKIYKRSQTIHESSSEGESTDEGGDHREKAKLPRKTSMLESGVSVLLPPLPPESFIVDPDSRPSAIFHDRIYKEEDLPPRIFRRATSSPFNNLSKQISLQSLTPSSNSPSSPAPTPDHSNNNNDGNTKMVEKSKVEERIAREWHNGMDWRKVLVHLEPDAHNNIIVRRRFANAFGWPVIDHMVQSHFGEPSGEAEKGENEKTKETKASATDIKLTRPRLDDSDIKRSSCDLTPIDILRQASNGNSSSSSAVNIGNDLSNLSIDTSVPDDGPTNTGFQPGSASTTGKNSISSMNLAWDFHLQSHDESSEEDGIVHSVGSWIDNIRNIGTFGTNENPQLTEEDKYRIPKTIDEDIEALP